LSNRLIHLDDARATDPAVVGAKAASLSVSKAAGLPVLGGFVIPIGEEFAAVATGTALLAARGSGAARLAIAGHGLDAALVGELVAAGHGLGASLVVRSSAVHEAEAVWAGAFASYGDIAPAELPQAIAGCWASLFTEDALARARAGGFAPGGIAMAVLVQPEIKPMFGGVAKVSDDTTVAVVGREGSPAPIVAGWDPGETVIVDLDGACEGQQALPAPLVKSVAAMARTTVAETGLDLVEWAADDAGLWLLQAQPAARPPAPAGDVVPPVSADPRLAAAARIIVEHPGPLGDSLVLPWAVGLEQLPPAAPPAGDPDPQQLLAAARSLALDLVGERWPNAAAAEDVLAGLRGADPTGALDRLDLAAPPDLDRGGQVLGLLDRLAAVLAEGGAIPRPATLSHLDLEEVARLCHGSAGPTGRLGRGRWEPFLVSTVSQLGVTIRGTGVVRGSGAGRLRLIRTPDDVASFRPREIVVATYPINNLAPLLWEAAAVVSLGGGPGAHLFEVAGSLGVPAVCGAALERAIDAPLAALAEASHLGAVDGATGSVAVLAAS
jgi:phosphohistidine swiveling domain-containing protein